MRGIVINLRTLCVVRWHSVKAQAASSNRSSNGKARDGVRSLAALWLMAVLLLLSATIPASLTHAQVINCPVVSMTITAVPSNDLPIPNLYKYCVTGAWDVGQFGLSHIDVLLMLQDCECRCDEDLIHFIQPAGQSTGEPIPCMVDYLGEYLCTGDPTLPPSLQVPAVKWDASGPAGCEPGTQGTGTWCFYSQLPPSPFAVTLGAIAIKHGREVCLGAVTGTLPSCECVTPAEASTWGAIKAVYR